MMRLEDLVIVSLEEAGDDEVRGAGDDEFRGGW